MTDTDTDLPLTPGEAEGVSMLARPVLPLVRIVQFLYLTGPFRYFEEILPRLHEPIETAAASYPDPAAILTPYLSLLKMFEYMKKPLAEPDIPVIVDEEGKEAGRIKAVELWVRQQLAVLELEQINSLLCEPCRCVLCCVGPDRQADGGRRKTPAAQRFFEVPLQDSEIERFQSLPRIDTGESRAAVAAADPPLEVAGRPFYESAAALYHWRSGWSLVLTGAERCPCLEPHRGFCRIYPERPEVCRRPQIFSYILEAEGEIMAARNKLLAVWDCPYVRKHRQAIISYAEQSGLEPVFKENKG